MSPIVWSSGAQASGERIERETKMSPFPTVHPWSCLSCLSERSHTALRWPRGPSSIRIPPGRSLKRLLESGLIVAALLLWSQTLGEKGYEWLCGINYTPSAEELRPWGRYLTTQRAELVCGDEIVCCFTSSTCRVDQKERTGSFMPVILKCRGKMSTETNKTSIVMLNDRTIDF